MKLIENLNWRYATKIFDASKKVSKEELEMLKEAIRLSVSAYGLQLYKVLIIENDEIRTELRTASWDQKQITDASHLFVFCNYTTNYDEHVDSYIQRVIEAQGSDEEALKRYGGFIKDSIKNMPSDERKSWSEKQTYLALNNLLLACAEMKIDACPMEGFENSSYNRILGLDEMGMNAAVIATVGYRAEEDEAQARKKVRKSTEELFKLA